MSSNLTLILLAINLATFLMVGIDKQKSLGTDRRFPEAYFFVWAVLFGSLGVLLGVLAFRHKIRKLYFVLGISLLLLQQALLLYLLMK